MGPYLAVGRGVKGELAIRRGDAAGGVETIRACLRELHDAGYELLTTTFNIALVHGLLALGQIERSARLIDDAIRLVEQGGDHLYMPELLRMKGRFSCRGRSRTLMRQKPLHAIAGIESPHRREGLGAAGCDRSRGAPCRTRPREEAKRLLQLALEGFAEGSETADIRAADKLLQTL